MRTRGRPSAEARAARALVERPEPPTHFSEEEREVWTTTTNGLPADWFTPESLPLLEAYCRHHISARNFSKMLEDVRQKPDYKRKIVDLGKLAAMVVRETQLVATLATKMRLSQRAKSKAKPVTPNERTSTGRKPWE